jgi:uncharacterized protein involved in outer membrane biogenesis
MKLLKILGTLVVALFALLVMAMVALLWLVNPNDLKPQLQQLAAQQGMQLNIAGDLGWSIFPQPGIRAGKFTLQPAMKNVREPFQFDDLAISVKLAPLLHRQLVADRILVHGRELDWHDDSGNNILAHQLLIDASDVNLDQRAFPLHLAMEIETTQPQRQIHFSSDAKIAVDQNLEHFRFDALAMQVDDTQLNGSVELTLGKSPFAVVDLAGTQMDLDRYFPATDETASAGKQEHDRPALHTKAQNGQQEIIPVSSINAVPGDFHLSFRQLSWQHLHGQNLRLALAISRDGVLTLKQLDVQAYDGELFVQGSLDVRPALPGLAFDVTLKHLSLAPALHDYAQTDAPALSGNVDVDAKITTRGIMQDQLLQNLNGTFSFHSDTLTLNGVDLTHSLDVNALQLLQEKLPALMSAKNQTTLTQVAATGNLQQGVIDNTWLAAKGLCSQFAGKGSYDLVRRRLHYRLALAFPSSDASPACGEINPVLKDRDWPFLCDGSLDNGAVKICGADKDGMNAIARDILRDQAKKALEKKFGDKIDSLKNAFRNLFH